MAEKQLADHRTTVRVTMFADPVEVDKDEIPHLRSQGILVEDDDQADAAPAGRRSRRSDQQGSGDDNAGSGTS